MKRYLVLFSLLLLPGLVATASAQVTYQLTSTPTFVTDTGRAETLGSIRLTSISPAGTNTIGSTIQVLYQNVACDNNQTNGVFAVGAGIFAPVGNVGTPTVTNVLNVTTGVYSCIVSFTIANGVAVAGTAADHIDVGGARGRVDLSAIADGGSVYASMNATPATSSLFTAPTTLAVATVEPGLVVRTVSAVTDLICIESGIPSLNVKEGYNASFVQYVNTVAGTVAPVPPSLGGTTGRPLAGANANTEITVKVTNLHPALTLIWPIFVCPDSPPAGWTCGTAAAITGNTPGNGSQLQLISVSTDSSTATYEYACADQIGQCDVNTESFTIDPDVTPSPAGAALTAPFLTATVAATLAPPTLTTGDPPASGAPFGGVGGSYVGSPTAPRFRPVFMGDGKPFVITGPCTTTLLYPWVALVPGLGYDTGIVVANTSADPSNLPAGNANWMALATTTPPEAGTCTLYGYNEPTPNAPTAPAHDLQFTTPSVPAGGSWAAPLSALSPFNAGNFTGYIIAICNFQYAHGFGYITENLTADNGIAQGYVALVIPDPVFVHARYATNTASLGFGLGEGLFQ